MLRNVRYGCEDKYSPTEEAKHMARCHFQLIRCVYHDVCLERIPLNRMAMHLAEEHDVESGVGTICTLTCDLAGAEGKVLGGLLMKNGESCIFVFLVHQKDHFRAVMTLLAPPKDAKGMMGKVSMSKLADKLPVTYSGPVNDATMCSKKSLNQVSCMNLSHDFIKKYFKKSNSMEAQFEFKLETDDPDSDAEQLSEESFMMQLQTMSAEQDTLQRTLEEKDKVIKELKNQMRRRRATVTVTEALQASGSRDPDRSFEMSMLRDTIERLRNPVFRQRGKIKMLAGFFLILLVVLQRLSTMS